MLQDSKIQSLDCLAKEFVQAKNLIYTHISITISLNKEKKSNAEQCIGYDSTD